jgi:tripartite-type tricarboxylate transporter receptor subunit TctC
MHVSEVPPMSFSRLPQPALLRLLATCLAIVAGPLHAQTWPAKPVRVVVPYAPGGGADVISRIMAARLTDVLGQQTVIDNRTGANGIVGSELVARAAPDGYTFLFVSSPFSVNPSLYPKLPFDTVRDFVPVSQVATAPYILVVHSSLPVKSLKELVALARARPGEIDYASGGAGGSPHLATELFKRMAKIDLNHVPYKGAGPALADVVAGQVQVMFANSAPALPHVRSGRLRALAISSMKRSPVAPDIPTVAESGYPGYQSDAVFGLVAPARTPPPIIDRISGDIRKAMVGSDAGERVKALGAELVVVGPAEWGRTLEGEMKRWGDLVRALGLKVE